MKVQETTIKGCCIIEPQVFEDERGYFLESFNSKKFFAQTGLDVCFVQDNESMSNHGVIRGLHAQQGASAQAKLIRVICGSVLDVVVDARIDSATFGEIFTTEISSRNKHQLFVPKGCLHGFSVLEDHTIFSYKCDAYYNPKKELGVNPLDPELAIDWQVDQSKVNTSVKDQNAQSWETFTSSLSAKKLQIS